MDKMLNTQTPNTLPAPADLLCFSHLNWDFVFQRPQHIMTRLAKTYTVYFIEEPTWHHHPDTYEIVNDRSVNVVKFRMSKSVEIPLQIRQRLLLDKLMKDRSIKKHLAWYYTPMAMEFSHHLQSDLTIYDCMDELSAFKFAPPTLKQNESLLLKKAGLVFTGGHSLYEAKKRSHHNIYPFPSSIDKAHFLQPRNGMPQPEDQQNIPAKRIGFYGVIDERFDIRLVAEVAAQRPDWQLVLIGPVVKIEESELPRLGNIHYLGGKTYDELPVYLSGWDIAFIPFEKNESTKYISPTKTPEYLAAGKPVISSSITDVVNPYAVKNLVHIADNSTDFIKAAEKIFAATPAEHSSWLERTDEFLSAISWDN
ncbi:MAG: glycosyltransferase family 1 protein, partial [Chitinophagaceae bacterium]